MTRRFRLTSVLLLAAAVACDSAIEGPEAANPLLGRTAFADACASCHATNDGFDLAYFSYPDSTITRRAVAHVDTATARHIVAYLRTLIVQPVARTHRPFQPGGDILGSDLELAQRLFGADRWPDDLTTDQVRAYDLRSIPTAIRFPLWSEEQQNLDWMPDSALPVQRLGQDVATAVAAYHASRTTANLRAAVTAIRSAERDSTNPAAPCVRPPVSRFQPRSCFEVRRWTATLIAQHALRLDPASPADSVLHNVWWDVGEAARIGYVRDGRFDNGIANWTTWMYVGWSFGAAHAASVWLSEALALTGLPRHAVFTALHTQVTRPPATGDPYEDVIYAVQFAPDSWVFPSALFGFRHLLERVKGGDVPPAGRQRERATLAISAVLASPRLTQPERDTLISLRDQISAYLQ